jgi:hypothetical protein
VDLRADLDDLEKRNFLTVPGLELRPQVVQPEASRYTDYAIKYRPVISSERAPHKNKILTAKE